MPLLQCHICSCDHGKYEPFCVRCGNHIYDGDFIEHGLVPRLREFMRWTIFGWVPRVYFRCVMCRRWMRPTRAECCSRSCDDAWVPF